MITKKLKIYLILALSLILLAVAVVGTYAWFQKTVERDGLNFTTGKINVAMEAYTFDTDLLTKQDGTTYVVSASDDSPTADALTVVDGNYYEINPTTPAKYYFIIYQQDDSIDLSYALSFRLMGMADIVNDDGSVLAGTPSNYLPSLQNAGDFKFVIDDIKSDQLFADGTVANPTYDEVKSALNTYLTNQSQANDTSIAELSAVIESLTAEINAEGTTTERIAECEQLIKQYQHTLNEIYQPAGGDNLVNLASHSATGKLALETDRFAVFSLTIYNCSANVEEYIGKSFKIESQLMVSQRNVDAGGKTYYISSAEQLESLLLGYEPGSNFYLTSDIIYKKDLTFNVPASLHLQSYRLTVEGNLTFSFNAPYNIVIDTTGGGQLLVVRNLNVGGHFRINAPASKVTLLGRGNINLGKGDIYVQSSISIGASFTDGLLIHKCNIYRSLDGTISTRANHPQTVQIEDGTAVTVSQNTSVGPISASTNAVQKVAIFNEGTIASVNFASMNHNGQDINVEPQIFLYNNNEITDNTIYLPSWSKKWYVSAVGNIPAGQGNTRIVQGMSSNELNVSGATSDDNSHFVKSDIEVLSPDTLVETIDGDYSQLLVRYYNKIEDGALVQTTLKSILDDWFAEHMDVYGATEEEWNDYVATSLTKLVVQNASGKFLTSKADVDGYDDYSYIRTMKALTHLDLSGAFAEVDDVVVPVAYDGNKNVTKTVEGKYAFLPAGALNGFASTTYIRIPNNTQVLFVNALPALREMHLPDTVIAVARTTANKSGLAQSRWLFVHTTSQVIEGLVLPGCATIVSVPDTMQSAYVSTYSTSATDDVRHRIMPEGVLDFSQQYLVREIATGEWELLRACPYVVKNTRTIGGNITMESGGVPLNIVRIGNYAYFEYSLASNYFYDVSGPVIFEQSVTSVGNYAFSYCGFGGTLDLVNVQTVGASAFMYTTITTLNAPNVREFGANAFNTVYNLKTIHINSAQTMGDSVFRNCDSLTTIDAEGATVFGNYAFYDCDALVNVSSTTVTSYIGTQCFAYCEKLETLNFPNVKSLWGAMAPNCLNLTTALFPSATNIGGSAFYNCPMLETVDIRSAKTIETKAFTTDAHNSKLRYVYAPNCTSVAQQTFDAVKICIFGAMESLHSWPIYHGDSGGIIYFFNHVGDVAETYESTGTQTSLQHRVITSESFAKKTTWADAAYNKNGERTIPDEDWDLENFYLSTDGKTAVPLLSVTHDIAANCKYVFFIKGNVCELVTIRTTKIDVAEFPSVITVTRDDGSTTSHPLTSIGEFACNGSNYVFKGADDNVTTDDTLVIPSTVTNIGKSAFYGATVYDLQFPDNSQLQTIGDYAFASITAMTGELDFPVTMTSIGSYAFYDTSLTRVTFANDGENDFAIGTYAFYNCADLQSDLTIPANVSSLGSYAFASTNLTNVTFAQRNGDLAVGSYAFNSCRNLASVTFDVDSTGSTTIGAYAFAYTNLLTQFQLVKSITSVGGYVFYESGMQTITSASNNNTDCTFATDAFRTAPNLVTIKLSPAVTKLPENFARNTVNLKHVEAEGVTTVGAYAFYYSKSLSFLYLPNAVSFGGCAIQPTGTADNVLHRVDIGSVTTWNNSNNYASLRNANGGILIVHGTKSTTSVLNLYNNVYADSFENGIVLMNSTNNGYYNGSLPIFYLPEGFSTDDIVGSAQTVDGFASKYLYIDMDDYNIEGNSGLYLVYCTARNVTSQEFLDDIALLESETGKKVTRIGNSCFMGCTFTDGVFTLPENVLRIGRIFYNFTSAEQVNFNSKLETIDTNAFYNKQTIKFGPLPASVKSVGHQAFYQCHGLGDLNLPNVETIGSYAFYNCDGIVSVNFGSNLTSLSTYVFYDCDAMTSFVASGLKSVGNYCFNSCGLLTLLDMPSFEAFEGTNSSYTLAGCTSLSLIKFGAYYRMAGQWHWGDTNTSSKHNGAIILCQPVTNTLYGGGGGGVYNQHVPTNLFPYMNRIGCYGSNQNVFPNDDGRESYLPEGITSEDLIFYGTRLINDVNVFEYIYARKADGSLLLVACLKPEVTAEQAELDLVAMEQDALARFGEECHFTEIQRSAYVNTEMSGVLIMHEGITTMGSFVYYQRSTARPKSFDIVQTNDLTSIPNYTFHQSTITSLVLDEACVSIGATSPLSPALVSNVTILQSNPDLPVVSASEIFESASTNLFVSARVYDNYKSGWAGIPTSRISTFDESIISQGANFYFIVDDQTGTATLTFVSLIDLDITKLVIPSTITIPTVVDGVTGSADYVVTAFDENAFLSIKDSAITTLVIPSELTTSGLNYNPDKFLQNLTAFELPTVDADNDGVADVDSDGNVIRTATNYSVVDGLLLSKDGSTLYVCPMKFVPTDAQGNATDVYVLPATVRSVMSNAFANCGKFTYTFFVA